VYGNLNVKYYSTNKSVEPVSFKDALLKGQANDRGLYMPSLIPEFTKKELEHFHKMSYADIAFSVIRRFIGQQVSDSQLLSFTEEAYDFNVPLEHVTNRSYIMRLDQGPTASFKDFAARMMGRLMNYFLKQENRQLLILTATSGDTGSAIANAFYGLDNIKVVILYPKNEVTDRQRKQMTTLGKNIQILSLEGKFDDCQALVKEAFADHELNSLYLSSANSINIGRLVPQSVYYFYAWSRLAKAVDEKIVFAVPSGNFGNLMGGIIAHKMGLPVSKFVVATNTNDEVPVYLRTNIYKAIVPSVNCISSAMNVGHPSNLARIIALYEGQMDEKGQIIIEPEIRKLKKDLWGISISDKETKETIRKVFNQFKVLLEPHGAVAWSGLGHYLNEIGNSENHLAVALETAHPAKFPAEINELLGIDPELPESLKNLDNLPESIIEIENNYKAFKAFLNKNYK
jgi:threonine synthase